MSTLHKSVKAFLVASLVTLVALPVLAQDNLKSPDDVKTGLRIINQVVGHTGRLIAAKKYDSVHHEHHEVVEGAEVLRDALDKEPADFQSKIGKLLDNVIAASAAMEDPAKMHDDAGLAKTHDAFADSVHKVLDMFPTDLQPATRN